MSTIMELNKIENRKIVHDSESHSSNGDNERVYEKELSAIRTKYLKPVKMTSQLLVTRCNEYKLKALSEFSGTGVVGDTEAEFMKESLNIPRKPNRLHVAGRKRKILNRCNLRRSNTMNLSQLNELDVSSVCNDKQSARLDSLRESNSESIDFLERIGRLTLFGSSMPDLSSKSTKLRVRQSRFTDPSESDDDLNDPRPKKPEFIMNMNLPSRHIEIDSAETLCRGTINVLLLNGLSMKIMCNTKTTTVQQVFEIVLKAENMSENFFLGLCVLIDGDFVFLPWDLKISKVASSICSSFARKANVVLTLYFRIKFYLPTLRGISSMHSLHSFYLQLRKDILENRVCCSNEDLVELGGLALQAEHGNFKQSMKLCKYFEVVHYLPEEVCKSSNSVEKYLRSSHFSKRGVSVREAEEKFVRYVQQLAEYGSHQYSAVWVRNSNEVSNVYVVISLHGISIVEKLSKTCTNESPNNVYNSANAFKEKRYATYNWLAIENLCFSKHTLCMTAHGTLGRDSIKTEYRFKMLGKKSFFAFNLALDHHKFYMKLQDSFASIQYILNELNTPLATDHSNKKVNCGMAGKSRLNQHESSSGKNDIKLTGKGCNSDGASTHSSNGFYSEYSHRNHLIGHSQIKNGLRENFDEKENRPPNSDAISFRVLKKMNTFESVRKPFMNKQFHECNPYTHASNENLEYKIEKLSSTLNRREVQKSIENDTSDESSLASKDYVYDKHFSSVECISTKSSSLSSLFSAHDLCKDFYNSPRAKGDCFILSGHKTSLEDSYFSIQNETMSESLLEKFNNVSSMESTVNDRIIKQITIRRGSSQNEKVSVSDEKYFGSNEMKLGISIVQGTANTVYVKSLQKNGLAEKSGIMIGDQILAVNRKSLLNLPYDESLKLLRTSGGTVELTVSQIFGKYQKQKLQKNEPLVDNGDDESNDANSTNPAHNISRASRSSTSNSQQYKFDDIEHVNGTQLDSCWRERQLHLLDDCYTVFAKSISDFSTVMGNTPKESEATSTMPRAGKKFVGHMRYPVTPLRVGVVSSHRRHLSLLGDNEKLDKDLIFG